MPRTLSPVRMLHVNRAATKATLCDLNPDSGIRAVHILLIQFKVDDNLLLNPTENDPSLSAHYMSPCERIFAQHFTEIFLENLKFSFFKIASGTVRTPASVERQAYCRVAKPVDLTRSLICRSKQNGESAK